MVLKRTAIIPDIINQILSNVNIYNEDYISDFLQISLVTPGTGLAT